MTQFGNGEESYEERNARAVNIGEEKFIALCEERGVWYQRLGFDEKLGKVPNFYRLNPTLRHLPDFVVSFTNKTTGEEETRLIAVKGTANFKREDYEKLDWFEQTYSSHRAPLYFVFMIGDKAYWKTIKEVKELFDSSGYDKMWESDKKEYRTLKF